MSEEEVSELFINQEDAQGNINYEGETRNFSAASK